MLPLRHLPKLGCPSLRRPLFPLVVVVVTSLSFLDPPTSTTSAYKPSCVLATSHRSSSDVTTTTPVAGARSHRATMHMSSASATDTDTIASWSDLRSRSTGTPVGAALQSDLELRKSGGGPAHVDNRLRLFDNKQQTTSEKPKITVYRDVAGWCPYCEKTILLVEEKKIPCNVEVVNMRSYGDKPQEFLRMVPNGLLPALVLEDDNGGNKRVITESQVIMEMLDGMHPPSEGYRAMMPQTAGDMERYRKLARLERELFSWWCTLIFRPEIGFGGGGSSRGGGLGGALGRLMGGERDEGEEKMSGAMLQFAGCLDLVDAELRSTPGPWFFDSEGPTMIDLIFVSHVERMLASCAYWKGMQIRGTGQWRGIDAWFDAFDRRESYLGFKSDFYTNVMDIPPQYGPGYDGGFEAKRKKFASAITGKDGKSWKLPLPHDEELEPLYRGPPLPLCALEAAGIAPSPDDQSYEGPDHHVMAKACRHAAGWKLASNGDNVAKFAARGGSGGSSNPRKTFAAPLADPYADPDKAALPAVDAALRVVCDALLLDTDSEEEHMAALGVGAGSEEESGQSSLRRELVERAVPAELRDDVRSSLEYLRDRVGVPRDMPLAAARQLRAHLNWAIDAI